MRQETRSVKTAQPGTLFIYSLLFSFLFFCENCTGNQLISLGRKITTKTGETKAAWEKPRYAFLIANLTMPDKNKSK